MASDKSQASKKNIINEAIFGENLDMNDPNQGISRVKIQAHETGHVPGVIKHWKKDLDRRKAEILKYRDQSFLQRASSLLMKKNKMAPHITGEELLVLHPTQKAQKLVLELKKNPFDMMRRLELVSMIGRAGRDYPIEVYRTLLLQAVIACSFNEMNNQGLQIVLWAQDVYFSKLYYRCKDQATRMEGGSSDEASRREGAEDQAANDANYSQRRMIAEQVKRIKVNLAMIRGFQRHAQKGIKDTSGSVSTTLSINEVNAFAMGREAGQEEESREEVIKKLFKKASEIANIVRYIPLLHPNAHQLMDAIQKVDANSPLPAFFKARISMSTLIFAVAQYQAGEQTQEVVKLIQTSFKETSHNYGTAVSRVGQVAKEQTDFTILIEYANLVHYFYRVSTNILGIRPPRPWLQTAFGKALRSLQLAKESGKTADLVDQIRKDMVHEGLAVD